MSKKKKTEVEVDSEKILISLDQIGQTIEVMTNVVGRLRNYVTEQNQPPGPSIRNELADIPHPHII